MNKNIKAIKEYEMKRLERVKDYYDTMENISKNVDTLGLIDLEIAEKQVKAYNSAIRKINKMLKEEYNELMNK